MVEEVFQGYMYIVCRTGYEEPLPFNHGHTSTAADHRDSKLLPTKSPDSDLSIHTQWTMEIGEELQVTLFYLHLTDCIGRSLSSEKWRPEPPSLL